MGLSVAGLRLIAGVESLTLFTCSRLDSSSARRVDLVPDRGAFNDGDNLEAELKELKSLKLGVSNYVASSGYR